jgi:adenine deaminase
LIEHQGGVAVIHGAEQHGLPMPVAGLMSNEDGFSIAKTYAEIDRQAKLLGTSLHAPFMTLSFMALLVIPCLKLSDKGLFDTQTFSLVDLEIRPLLV